MQSQACGLGLTHQGRSQGFEVEEAETMKILSLVMPTSLILGTWEVMCGSKANLHNYNY